MKASYYGYIEVVRELIERGADMNAKDNQKRRRDKEKQHYHLQLEEKI